VQEHPPSETCTEDRSADRGGRRENTPAAATHTCGGNSRQRGITHLPERSGVPQVAWGRSDKQRTEEAK